MENIISYLERPGQEESYEQGMHRQIPGARIYATIAIQCNSQLFSSNIDGVSLVNDVELHSMKHLHHITTTPVDAYINRHLL